ncbi:MAG TPA: hypothetical protein PLP59_09505 [Thermotogota bacterium]|jgi:hypothetical protein|nr:hypothetical protein [Thermotogota bacterium]HPH11303.1 hypothetical protein [Thermotogota bacterium]HPM21650.1 hypothetical protein [Thermotogota bacterium]HQN22591.1 hypothetical protein [Thermotogota bacterium]HQQ66367.1 hypothetical protein [Thermotogota bacterium]
MAESNLTALRGWIVDTDKKMFADADLTRVLERNGAIVGGVDVAMTPKMLDLSRADCYEMIVGDPVRWASYSVGGLSETYTKAEIMQLALQLRSRWAWASGDFT